MASEPPRDRETLDLSDPEYRQWLEELPAGPGSLPSRLGPYRILGEIGRGGMGVVYLAEDTRLDRRVAVKLLPESVAKDPAALGRFEREAKTLASLSHPNIAVIHSLEYIGGFRFFTLELVEGETFMRHIAARAPALAERLLVCRQLAWGLESAHGKGIIHRDLKPENLKVTPEGQLKILDFGLAKVLDPGEAKGSNIPSEAIRGTPGYMSPEQLQGRALDARADIWSFGCLLYEALSGKKLFVRNTIAETIAATLKEEPNGTTLPADLPAPVREIIRRCLAKDADARLAHIAEAKDALDDAILALRDLTPPRLDLGEEFIALRDRALKVGDRAPEFRLRNARGEWIASRDLLAKGPLVVTFYRGRWCPVCNVELETLQTLFPRFESLGASLVAISPQLEEHSRGLAMERNLSFEVLSDPGNRIAGAFGTVIEVDPDAKAQQLSLGLDLAVFNGDDSWTLPQPSRFIIDGTGTIRYATIDRDLTERVDPHEVLAALEQLVK